MKVYIPFFIISLCMSIIIFYLYNPVFDYEVSKNIYGYKNDSFDAISKDKLVLNGYYRYIDCKINDNNFNLDNLDIYIKVDDCSIDVLKINALSQFYSDEDVLKLLEKEFDYLLINEDNFENALKYIFDDNFDSLRFNRYLTFDRKKAVLNVNLNHDLKEYKDYNDVSDFSELMIVNGYNRLVTFNTNLYYCRDYYVFSDDMCANLKNFLEHLNNENIKFQITKVFDRSDLFSEHATGLAINLEYDFSISNYVEKLAASYGFILRYKKEYLDVTSHEESGHFRYVGASSSEVYQLQISLEEYIYINN